MKTLSTLCIGTALLLACEASAVNITLNFGSVPQQIFFAGQPQQSTLQLNGLSPSFDISYGVPASVAGYEAWVASGLYDPSTSPAETVGLSIAVASGAASGAIQQDFFFRQIANDQFQFDAFDTAPVTLDLANLGILTIKGNAAAVQCLGQSGFGMPIWMTVTLQPSAVPDGGQGPLILCLSLLALGAFGQRYHPEMSLERR